MTTSSAHYIIEKAFTELPDDADAIAQFLRDKGIMGRKYNGSCCPIANYLKTLGEFPDLFVSESFVSPNYKGDLEGMEDSSRIRTPLRVEHFITRFDAECYKDLIDSPRFGIDIDDDDDDE